MSVGPSARCSARHGPRSTRERWNPRRGSFQPQKATELREFYVRFLGSADPVVRSYGARGIAGNHFSDLRDKVKDISEKDPNPGHAEGSRDRAGKAVARASPRGGGPKAAAAAAKRGGGSLWGITNGGPLLPHLHASRLAHQRIDLLQRRDPLTEMQRELHPARADEGDFLPKAILDRPRQPGKSSARNGVNTYVPSTFRISAIAAGTGTRNTRYADDRPPTVCGSRVTRRWTLRKPMRWFCWVTLISMSGGRFDCCISCRGRDLRMLVTVGRDLFLGTTRTGAACCRRRH